METPDNLWSELQQLTAQMLEAARREEWAALSQLENLRQKIVLALKNSTRSAIDPLMVKKINESNQLILSIVKRRHDDLSVLLADLSDAHQIADRT